MKKSYDSKFKSRVALEALRGDLTVAEIAGKYQIHPNLVQQWKKKLQDNELAFKVTINSVDSPGSNSDFRYFTSAQVQDVRILPSFRILSNEFFIAYLLLKF